jgi:hypothetical protein
MTHKWNLQNLEDFVDQFPVKLLMLVEKLLNAFKNAPANVLAGIVNGVI